jgi:hypothetical protein
MEMGSGKLNAKCFWSVLSFANVFEFFLFSNEEERTAETVETEQELEKKR